MRIEERRGDGRGKKAGEGRGKRVGGKRERWEGGESKEGERGEGRKGEGGGKKGMEGEGFARGRDLYLDRSCGARGYLGAQASTCLVLHVEYHSLCRPLSMYFDPTVCVR